MHILQGEFDIESVILELLTMQIWVFSLFYIFNKMWKH